MKKVSFYTLGCKLNQAETAVMAEQFEEIGIKIVPFGEPADLCVINTCTVTGKTDYRCRQMIRRAKKDSPEAKIAVVGCYAQLRPEKISEIGGVDFIFGSDQKFSLVEYLTSSESKNIPITETSANRSFKNPAPGNFWDHTRAFLKIQDGCDNLCSYCTVPLARGKSRSDTPAHIVDMAKQLAHQGHKEIVITGVHIGRYGFDLSPKQNLLVLLQKLEEIETIERIRLSSLEPLEINNDLIQWIATSDKICHHLHIPLQSGDPDVLKRMNRNYTGDRFLEAVQKVHSSLPGSGLGTDVIVGFPGETEAQFQNSVEMVEKLPFTYLHVFSYSRRPGTRAFHFPNQVDAKEIKRRSEILRSIGRRKKKEFLKSHIGRTVRVLWEEKHTDRWMSGLTDTYVKVRAKTDARFINRITAARVERADEDFLFGALEIPD